MTIEDYWEKELNNARKLSGVGQPDELVAALLIARQLRDIITHLNSIEAQLSLIQQAIEE